MRRRRIADAAGKVGELLVVVQSPSGKAAAILRIAALPLYYCLLLTATAACSLLPIVIARHLFAEAISLVTRGLSRSLRSLAVTRLFFIYNINRLIGQLNSLIHIQRAVYYVGRINCEKSWNTRFNWRKVL